MTYFNSRVEFHKTPFGASAAGSEVVLRVCMPKDTRYRRAELVLRRDGGEELRLPLAPDGGDAGADFLKVSLIPDSPGLYYYYFDFGGFALRLGGAGEADFAGGEWQMTVYDPALTAPSRFAGGVMYQIFPDRFCKSGEPHAGVPADRLLRDDFGGDPMWEPDENGRITRYDFFGGDLRGIEKKLDFLASLGVTCIYLNPIFESHSNHRYDTADYLKIDPLLGDEDDFVSLCREAHGRSMTVILDGVFNHTGADSVYFNRYGRYGDSGAFRSKDSPYYPWYKFIKWNTEYMCWWGFDNLPEVDESNAHYVDFITGAGGVARRWLALGADGWRIDVADELPDDLLRWFYSAVKEAKPEALVIGEVWEDASNKISYGERRHYLEGGRLDTVMNYPFADAVLGFVKSGESEGFHDRIMSILENYPAAAVNTLMNHIGTHDTVRALSLLAGDTSGLSPISRWFPPLDATGRARGIELMKCAAALQYTLPGVPCIYYGDEAGLEGGMDPYNRRCYPWGDEDTGLLEFYRLLGSIRAKNPLFADARYVPISDALGCVAFVREGASAAEVTVVNRNSHPIDYRLPPKYSDAVPLTPGSTVCGDTVNIPAVSGAILLKKYPEV